LSGISSQLGRLISPFRLLPRVFACGKLLRTWIKSRDCQVVPWDLSVVCLFLASDDLLLEPMELSTKFIMRVGSSELSPKPRICAVVEGARDGQPEVSHVNHSLPSFNGRFQDSSQSGNQLHAPLVPG